MKSYSIGRDNACDIVLNDHTDVISRRHAVLTVSSSGKMTITDQSTNGTYINGQKISPNVPVPVKRKDTISFAHVATLDWNMIPKSKQWLTYLLVGIGVAMVAALAVLYFVREKPAKLVEEVVPVVDTIPPQPQKEVQTTYTVTFEANGGQGAMEPQQVPIDTKVGLVGNTYSREGYDFVGWNTQADGKGTAYEDKATVTFTSDMTLYAQWKQRTHKVTFVPNANNVRNKMEDQEVVEGTDTELSKNEFKRRGFTFTGWNTQRDGKGTPYDDKAVVNLKEDLKLYAQWKENGSGKKDTPKNEKTDDNEKGKGKFL